VSTLLLALTLSVTPAADDPDVGPLVGTRLRDPYGQTDCLEAPRGQLLEAKDP
jgi:hypothetical protein